MVYESVFPVLHRSWTSVFHLIAGACVAEEYADKIRLLFALHQDLPLILHGECTGMLKYSAYDTLSHNVSHTARLIVGASEMIFRPWAPTCDDSCQVMQT